MRSWSPVCGFARTRPCCAGADYLCPAEFRAGFRMLASEVTRPEGGCDAFAQKLAQKPPGPCHPPPNQAESRQKEAT